MAVTMREKLEAAAEIIQLVKKYEGLLPNYTVCIGNPPYTAAQKEHENQNGSAGTAVYPDFFGAAFTMADKVSIISPARWFNSPDAATRAARAHILEKGLGSKFRLLSYCTESSSVFPTVRFSGGVSWYLYDNNYDGETAFIENNEYKGKRSLLTENGTVNINANHTDLLKKVNERLNPDEKFLQVINWKTEASSGFVEPFGNGSTETILANTTLEPQSPDDVRFRIPKHGWRFVPAGLMSDRARVPKGKFAICFTHASNGKRARHLNDRTFFLSENESAKSTMAVILDSPQHAANFYNYASTRFFRVLVEARLSSHDTYPQAYQDVPAFKWDETDPIDWSKGVSEIDAQLEEYFDLSDLHDYLQSPDAPFAAPFEDEYIQKFASYGITLE